MEKQSFNENTSVGKVLIKQAWQYVELMRLNRPIGIWLLLWPMLWGLWIAGEGRPDQKIFVIFVLAHWSPPMPNSEA